MFGLSKTKSWSIQELFTSQQTFIPLHGQSERSELIYTQLSIQKCTWLVITNQEELHESWKIRNTTFSNQAWSIFVVDLITSTWPICGGSCRRLLMPTFGGVLDSSLRSSLPSNDPLKSWLAPGLGWARYKPAPSKKVRRNKPAPVRYNFAYTLNSTVET